MILVAPDKFRGTMTASEAACIIADVLGDDRCLKAPMADGGEGTEAVLTSLGLSNVIESSRLIGHGRVKVNIIEADSEALGREVASRLKETAGKIYIGIGGTATCDGGEGFLRALSVFNRSLLQERIVGLCDVKVPLVEAEGQLSALSFCPQKGATPEMMSLLRNRLEEIRAKYGSPSSPFDGAGGGLGFAIASVIGAECHLGAEFIADCYHFPWENLTAVITGEGCVENQTATGKVVATMARFAERNSVPCYVIGGRINDVSTLSHSCVLLNTMDFPGTTPQERLANATRQLTF